MFSPSRYMRTDPELVRPALGGGHPRIVVEPQRAIEMLMHGGVDVQMDVLRIGASGAVGDGQDDMAERPAFKGLAEKRLRLLHRHGRIGKQHDISDGGAGLKGVDGPIELHGNGCRRPARRPTGAARRMQDSYLPSGR